MRCVFPWSGPGLLDTALLAADLQQFKRGDGPDSSDRSVLCFIGYFYVFKDIDYMFLFICKYLLCVIIMCM